MSFHDNIKIFIILLLSSTSYHLYRYIGIIYGQIGQALGIIRGVRVGSVLRSLKEKAIIEIYTVIGQNMLGCGVYILLYVTNSLPWHL